jgi:glycosyltransferase involved in cell wall biosynthesis
MRVEFIIPTYNNPDHLMCIISSIRAQTKDAWKVHVVADCPPVGTLNKIMDYFKEDDRIKFTILNKRYNDFGDSPRNYGIEKATEEWIVMTGEDNYYAPIFVEEILSLVDDKTNFIYCNMILDHKKKIYVPVNTRIELGFIDTGCYAVKSNLAKEIKLEPQYVGYADWVFADKYTKKFGGIKHTKKMLYVHN